MFGVSYGLRKYKRGDSVFAINDTLLGGINVKKEAVNIKKWS